MAKKEYVGVINARNKTRVVMMEVGSPTHIKAMKGIGNWSLANPEQEKAYTEKKSSAKSADVEKPTQTVDETPNAPEPNTAQPEPTEELKPKAKSKGGRPKKENS